jgi:hypothetical protein
MNHQDIIARFVVAVVVSCSSTNRVVSENYYHYWWSIAISVSISRPVPVTAHLRHRSTAARLLRSWVRIPPGAWMYVCCVCVVR